MTENPERIVVITLPASLASVFDSLLREYAELMGAGVEECRAGVESIVAAAGIHALNVSVLEHRKLSERMGWV